MFSGFGNNFITSNQGAYDAFTDNVRKAFELYLLGNKQEAFSHVIPGSKYHNYLKILDDMKEGKYPHTLPNDEFNHRFTLRKLLLQYDDATTDEERQSLITKIGQHISVNYNHTKPLDLARKSHKNEDRKSSEKLNCDKETYNTICDTKTMVTKALNNPNKLSVYLHKSLYNEVDYNSFTDDTFKGFIVSGPNIYDITCESFLNKYAKILRQRLKSQDTAFFDYSVCWKLTIKQMETLESKVPELQNEEAWIGKLFEKKFHYELDTENINTFTLEERREQLINMYEASENRPRSLRSSLAYEILIYGMKLDIYNKNYFLDYLENPLQAFCLNQDYAKKATFSYTWPQYLPNILKNMSQGDLNTHQKMHK